ncbi:MAG: fumarylacetoacetate hydrolase family protein [Caldilineaceae bacterium]
MERPTLIHAGDYLAGLRFSRRQIESIPAAIRPTDLDTAYAIQDVVVKRLLAREGGHRIGYKIACTSKGAQEMLHVPHPLYGQMLSFSSHTAPATVRRADFTQCVIEAEFGFRMATDVPASPTDYTAETIVPFIDTILPAIEIVNFRFVDWTVVGANAIAADNAIHGAWVYGEPVTQWQQLDLAAHKVTLTVNDRQFDTGTGAAVLGHPLNALAWLANELPRHSKQLRQGDAVTTGVCMDVYFAEAGDRVTADFGPLGKVELQLI